MLKDQPTIDNGNKNANANANAKTKTKTNKVRDCPFSLLDYLKHELFVPYVPVA